MNGIGYRLNSVMISFSADRNRTLCYNILIYKQDFSTLVEHLRRVLKKSVDVTSFPVAQSEKSAVTKEYRKIILIKKESKSLIFRC